MEIQLPGTATAAKVIPRAHAQATDQPLAVLATKTNQASRFFNTDNCVKAESRKVQRSLPPLPCDFNILNLESDLHTRVFIYFSTSLVSFKLNMLMRTDKNQLDTNYFRTG